uniref:von Willebrand factor A domain-containing protein 7-like n=1 Tax=Knipowitschia caucasica TaxID=637954 RepID=A0AAV2JD29_KNICA
MTCGLVVLSLFLVVTGVRGFSLDHDGASQSHWEITEEAVLRATAEACRAEAREEGRIFTLPATLTPQSLLEACEAKQSAGDFAKNKFQIKSSNALVNIDYALVPSRHFDNEEFEQGKKIITDGLFTVKVNIKNKNYGAARRGLGEILHTIQDFYSHSNWVEMGNDHPFTNLIQSGDSLEYSTAKHRPTCRNCSDDCTGNILEDILSERLLTSGYFSPRSSNIKPTGKCSHGGDKDTTTHTDATGGINKDSVNSSHGHLHERAARVATEASIELLDDVHAAVGHKNFLRMMGVGSGKAIIFVIDTTQSMVSDIVFIRLVTIMTIQQLEGTENEPSVYILVPFNDPGFGPVTKTTNGNVFISAVTNLTANGGGDSPEKSLSGLQLALSVAPIGSELFVFTDAPPKDTHLKNTILALIERTQCVVNFVISNNTLKEPIYTDLAKASGGQVVTLKKSDVFSTLTLLLDSSNSVTLLQAARKSSDNFMFSVAETETDLRLFITGTTDFTLVSPSGVVQKSSTGPLTTSKQTVGDLLLVRLTHETGQWNIRLRSTNSYTLKITVRSPVNFFFSFMQESEFRSTGLAPETNKPSAGQNATLVVVLFGSDSATLKEAYLVYSSGAGELKGNITGHEDNEYLVHFDNLPSEEISVLVKLQDGSSLTKTTLENFQRQALTSIQPSSFSIVSSIPSASLEPGSTFFTNLTISTEGTEGNFTIQVSNNQNLPSTILPAIVNVMRGRSAIAAPEIFIPNTTAPGTEIIAVVEVGDAKDFNYKRLTLTVITPVTDIHAPVFSRLSPDPNCTDTCTSTYQLSILVTDDTVLNRIFVREGNGILTFTSTPDKQ